MEWSQELCLKFIEDYRQYPELWRILDSNYKNKLKRNEALKELAEKYATNLKTVLNKIKSLRSYFHKEHSKIVKKRRESVSNSDDVYVSNWFAYKSLVFILENDLARPGRDQDYEINNEDSDPACDEPVGEYEDACSTPEDIYPVDEGKEPSPSPAPKKTRKNDAEGYHYKPMVKKKVEERDEFAIFGEYIASKLRKLKDARLQSVVQNRITNMIFEIEMGLLSCPGPSHSNPHPANRNSNLSSRGSHSQSGGQLLLEPEITLVESNGANFINFLSPVPGGGDSSSCFNKPFTKRANHNRIMESGLGQGALVLDCSIGDKR